MLSSLSPALLIDCWDVSHTHTMSQDSEKVLQIQNLCTEDVCRRPFNQKTFIKSHKACEARMVPVRNTWLDLAYKNTLLGLANNTNWFC